MSLLTEMTANGNRSSHKTSSLAMVDAIMTEGDIYHWKAQYP